jgi:hypothetical protein
VVAIVVGVVAKVPVRKTAAVTFVGPVVVVVATSIPPSIVNSVTAPKAMTLVVPVTMVVTEKATVLLVLAVITTVIVTVTSQCVRQTRCRSRNIAKKIIIFQNQFSDSLYFLY